MKLLRNRDRHAPGHPTRFAAHERTEPARAALDEPADEFVRSPALPSPELAEVSAPATAADVLAHDSDEYVAYDALMDSTVSQTTLTEFAGHQSWMLREAVASNPKSPDAAFDSLATDDEGAVITALLNNKSTPASALVILSARCDPDDQFYVDKMTRHLNWPSTASRTPASRTPEQS